MNQVISAILTGILSALNKETFKKVVDAAIDKVEELVVSSDNKIDDIVVLPLCKKLREILEIPDEDGIG